MDQQSPHAGSMDGAQLRARALAGPTRAGILARLRASPEPLTAARLAGEIGIHQTAVRRHLAVLVSAGLVTSQRLPVVGRGRPLTGYTARAELDPYRDLASMLTDAVSAKHTAREAGRAAGRRVAPSPAGPLRTLRDEAERLGFEPNVVERGAEHEVVLRVCPFADLAAQQQDIICELHVGLAEGIAERDGSIEVLGIRMADPHVGGCRIVTRHAAT